MQFFASAVTTLQTLVVALGAGLAVWGVVNLLEGYGSANACLLYTSRADFQAKPADEQIRDIRKNILPDFICRHAPPPLSVPAGAAFSPVPLPAGAAPGSAAAGIWPVSAPNGNTRQSSP